jgi:hypothetical protein
MTRFEESLADITPPESEFGRYVGEVIASWEDDGRKMRLVEPFAYEDPEGVRWDAPAGSVVDGASIPQIAWTVIGGPFEGLYRNASVIHDVACVNQSRPWRNVHKAFYNAMLASAVRRVKAKIMYAAVFHFGPRWADAPPRTLREEQFPQLQAEIESRETQAPLGGATGTRGGYSPNSSAGPEVFGDLTTPMSLTEIEGYTRR